MYGIFESSITHRRSVKTGFETLDAAKEYAHTNFDILCMDDDFENDAADFITTGMTIYAVEREKKA